MKILRFIPFQIAIFGALSTIISLKQNLISALLKMKYTKFIYIILLSLLSFFRGTETHHQQSNTFSHCISLDTVSTDDAASYSDFSSSKNLKVHYIIKKKIKARATTLEQSTIKAPYFSNLVNFKLYKKSLIYGIASIYQVQRHTYLHLYQLF